MSGARVALVIGVLAAALAARAPGDSSPNIVLFFPDTLSAEAMGPLFNNPIVQTPVCSLSGFL